MATSGSKSIAVTSWDTLKFSWSEASQSTANNTTTINWSLQLVSTSSGAIYSSASKSWSVTVNGTTYSGSNSVAIGNNTTKTLASGSTTIKHNANGTKSFSYSFYQVFAITFSNKYIGTISSSGTGTLDTIPRASSVACTTANIGSAATITITRAASSFTHTLTYTFGSLSGTIATKTTATTYSWTIPTSFYAQIPNAKTGTGTLKCETFSGSTSVGSKSISFKVTTNEALCKPTLSPTLVDINEATIALTGDANRIVKNASIVRYDIGATARNSATISKQTMTNGSFTTSLGSGDFSGVQSMDFIFSATDSRGYSSTVTVSKSFIEYVPLTVNIDAPAPTTDGETTITISGNYFDGSFGAESNSLDISVRWVTGDGLGWSYWANPTPTISGNTYEATQTYTDLDYQETYYFQVRVGDKLITLEKQTKKIKTTPIFDWGENDFSFNVPVTFNQGIANGNKVLWSGGMYMDATHTATLSEAISAQAHGIVLVFSYYDSGVQDYSFNTFFVSKEQVALFPSCGHTFIMGINAGFSSMGAKYLYFTDTTVKGHAGNTTSGTNSGITFNNSKYVLRYVIGV